MSSETEQEHIHTSLMSRFSGDRDSDAESDSETVLGEQVLFDSASTIVSSWASLNEQAIILDALQRGTLSLAYAFLKAKFQPDLSFDHFRVKCFEIILGFVRQYKVCIFCIFVTRVISLIRLFQC